MVELNHKRKVKAANQRKLIKEYEAKLIEQKQLVKLCMKLGKNYGKDDAEQFLREAWDIHEEAQRIIENRKLK